MLPENVEFFFCKRLMLSLSSCVLSVSERYILGNIKKRHVVYIAFTISKFIHTFKSCLGICQSVTASPGFLEEILVISDCQRLERAAEERRQDLLGCFVGLERLRLYSLAKFLVPFVVYSLEIDRACRYYSIVDDRALLRIIVIECECLESFRSGLIVADELIERVAVVRIETDCDSSCKRISPFARKLVN